MLVFFAHTLIFVHCLHFFAHISRRTRTVRTNATRKEVDRAGRPDKVVEGCDPSSVSRVACAQSFFYAGVKIRFSGFLFETLLCTRYHPLFEMLVFFAHAYLIENGTACHNSEFPVQGQDWGKSSSKLERAACRAPCVTHACAVCRKMGFFSKEEKNRSPVQIAWVKL